MFVEWLGRSSREGIRARLVRGSTMKGSIAAVLAAGACGVGFLAGWLVFHSDGTCKIDLPPTQPLQRAEAERPMATSDRAPDLEKSDSRVVVQSAPVELHAAAPAAPPVESAATPTAPAPPDPRNLPESTTAEMNAKRDAIQAVVNDLKRSIIKRRFDQGLFDHMSDDRSWRPAESDWDRSVISYFRSGPNGCDRINIPRDQYPELYAYYDDVLRLEDRIQDPVWVRLTTGK